LKPVQEAEGIYELPGVPGMVTAHGIRIKILITRDVRPTDRPGGAAAGSRSLQPFELVFLQAVHGPGNGPVTHYQVSESPKPETSQGCIPKDAGLMWPSRVGWRPAQNGTRVSILPIWESQADAEEFLRGSTKVQPIASLPLGEDDRVAMPWPILEHASARVDGREVQVFRVGMVGAKDRALARAAGGRSYSEAEYQTIRRQLHQVDVCFVIDSTGSMSPYIEAVKKVVAELARRLAKMDPTPDLRLSLTLFRDVGDEYIVRYSPLEPAESFLKRLAETQATGGGDAPEAGFMAVKRSLETTFRERSTRVLVLVADAPFHESGKSNPQRITPAQLAGLAQRKHVVTYALAVGRQEEWRDRQLEEMAAPTGGKRLALGDAQEVVSCVRKLLTDQAQLVGDLVNITGDFRQGRDIDEIVAIRDVPRSRITYCVELLRKTKAVDPSRLPPDATVVLDGWVVSEFHGVALGSREVYLYRPELEHLIRLLTGLTTGPLDPAYGRRVHRSAVPSRLLDRWRTDANEVGTLDAFLAAQGIPSGPHSILRLTRKELENLSERERLLLRERCWKHLALLNGARGNNAYWLRNPDGTISGWIPETMLP
jgi:Mg-chelatase subunit ChlD